jgi:hypothetical protein
VFKLDWQQTENTDRIAVALERGDVGLIDVTRIAALQT